MSPHVLVHEDVLQTLSKITSKERYRILEGLRQLALDPTNARPEADIRKLRAPGRKLYRLRVGPYRAIYCVDGDDVLVTDLIRRSQAYRGSLGRKEVPREFIDSE